MATTAEIQAAIAKAEAKGRKDLADKLRARLSEASDAPATVPDQARVEAAIAKAEAAGRKDLADKLRAAMPAPVAMPDTGPAIPTIDTEDPAAKDARLVAMFEAANPALAGRYQTAAELPRVGDAVIGGGGGGGRGGAPRVTVQPWQNVQADTFGDTAAAMMEGPVAGMKAFGGGLVGGESPSRSYLKEQGVPGVLAAPLGVVGDIGGAALAGLGAGISGAIGLGAELVPGQGKQAEQKLAEDVTGMSMFAVPELAGASSIPARVAAAAPKAAPVAAPVARAAPKIADDIVAAVDAGIPVMRSDVKPPKTFIGGVAQKAGESIPIAGTGAMRATQNEARIEATRRFAHLYGADNIAPAIDDVAAGLLEKRSADIRKFSTQKREVIEGLADAGTVPVPKAVAAIDAQIAKLKGQKMASLDPVIAKLEEFKAAIKDQKLTEIEANRAVIGEAFSGLDMGAIRGVGEKALSAVYGPLRDDMAAFIKSAGGSVALNKWGSANARLADMAGELGNSTLKRALSKGDASPEVVRSMLFSAKPSDVKLLYRNLDERGKASARTAVIQEAIAKAGGLEDISPDRFKQAMGKLGSQVGVFFKGDDFAAADGLVRALRLTERAGKAGVTPLTGVQNVPAVVGVLVSSLFGGSIPATVAALGGIGGIARLYEATGVKSALRALGKAETPKAQGSAVQSLAKALDGAGVPVGEAAAQTAQQPDFETLWRKYAQ